MMKKVSLLSVGNYQHWIYNEDYFLWCRMYIAGCIFMNIPDVLVNVRVGAEMYKRRGGKEYFMSEVKLQTWMYRHNIINIFRLILNISIRFIIQILMPNSLRGILFQKLFRKHNSGK
jgi:hypothetical protein